jgi:hypothetical protein
MTELKTLKDFEPDYHKDSFTNMPKEILIKELRQEAIKWIKAIRNGDYLGIVDEVFDEWEFPEKGVGAQAILIHIFNITEEELK